MKQSTVEVLLVGTSGLSIFSSVTSSIISFFEVYATPIGSVCAILTLLFMIIFGVIKINKLSLANENLEEIKKLKLKIIELEKQGGDDEKNNT